MSWKGESFVSWYHLLCTATKAHYYGNIMQIIHKANEKRGKFYHVPRACF